MASSPTPAMDLPTILADLQGLLGRRDASLQEFQNWEGGAVNGGANGDGIYPLTDSTGLVRNVACPAKIIAQVNPMTPEAFGAIGDDASHPASTVFATLAACQAVYPFATSLAQEMDYLAWQKMVNTPGSYKARTGATYKMCNSNPDSQQPLNIVAGVSDVDGAYCNLNYSDMRQKTSDAHFVDNYNFATSDGWQNSAQYGTDPTLITMVDFSQGYASLVDPWDGTKTGGKVGQGPYYEFGHALTLQPGRYRAVIEGTATRGASYDHGNLNPTFMSLAFSEYGVGAGPSVPTDRSTNFSPQLDATNPTTTPVPFSSFFDFEITATSSGYIVVRGGGYLSAKVTRVDVVSFIPNAALLLNRDGAPEHYFNPKRMRRMNLKGPSAYSGNTSISSGTIGCLWKSFESLDGDLQDMETVHTTGFGIGHQYSDGAYLMVFWDCTVEGDTYCVDFQPGNFNAGENIKYYGGSMANRGNGAIFNNPGSAEFTLFGTICDYSTQLVENNAGLLRIIGARHEQNLPKDATKPIWHCLAGGRVIYIGSYVLLAGNNGPGVVPPAKLDTALSSIEFHSTQIYNLSSSSGYCIDGPGRINFYGFINAGNTNIGTNMVTLSRHSDCLGGAGCFDVPADGTVQFQIQDKTGIYLEGGIVVSASDEVMTDRWNSNYLKCSVSTDYAQNGTQSLKVQKLTNADNTVYKELHMLVPFERVGNLLGQMYFLFPNDITDQATISNNPNGPVIYYRQFNVRVIGHDSLGRPIYGNNAQFRGETDIGVPIKGDPVNRVRRGFKTTYQTAATDDASSDRSPQWATHLAIVIDIQNIPAMTFYIDGLQANFFG